jgi:hypothetical protein
MTEMSRDGRSPARIWSGAGVTEPQARSMYSRIIRLAKTSRLDGEAQPQRKNSILRPPPDDVLKQQLEAEEWRRWAGCRRG